MERTIVNENSLSSKRVNSVSNQNILRKRGINTILCDQNDTNVMLPKRKSKLNAVDKIMEQQSTPKQARGNPAKAASKRLHKKKSRVRVQRFSKKSKGLYKMIKDESYHVEEACNAIGLFLERTLSPECNKALSIHTFSWL